MSKKGAKPQPKEQSYDVRDIVLAKVRGYPPWPGIVVDPDSVPKNVAKERPNGKSKKGNWYCVRFFPAGDYAWAVPKDISKLQQHEIQAYIDEPFKKSGDLLQGYKIALDPKKWEEEREAMAADAGDDEEEGETEEVDQLDDSVDDDDGEKKPKTKKRKRDSDAAPPKKPKAKAKKEPAEPKKKAASAAKGKKNGIKSKAMVESEDEAERGEDDDDDDAGPSKKASPPPAKKQKKGESKEEDEADAATSNDPEASKVKEWRHRLQKAFLGKTVPKDEDMPGFDTLFTTVESYENMTIFYLQTSKIGKVMRHIYALPKEKVPRDDEFKFRDRAKVLVDRWHEVLSNKDKDATVRKPAANGKPHAEDAGASANGKDETVTTNGKDASPAAPEPAKADADAMDVDTKDAQGTEEDAPAEPEDAPAAGVADESALADVTMSEAA